MWSDGLAAWFETNGRHHLPWRLTTDPWAVLVSEVMLQQTSVARVLPRWRRFLDLWPSPAACAAAPLDDVLREWQGLGYPRRARALWLTAAEVGAGGWPDSEGGLRALPGVGGYTARALLAFSDAGAGAGAGAPAPIPPRDVNLGRVGARAALGVEPWQAPPRQLDAALAAARPAGVTVRDYTHALFDVGALHCRARPRCTGCPLRQQCALVAAPRRVPPSASIAPPLRQTRYAGSLRQLRGAVLAAALELRTSDATTLAAAVGSVEGATPERINRALHGLRGDGLIRETPAPGGAAGIGRVG